jgi:glutamate dehydrogenase (NAD(P)+)
VLFVCNEAVKKFSMKIPETRVVVQGAGNVGGTAARLMHEAGYKVIAISDIFGGIVNAKGLDIPDVLRYLRENKTVEGYEGADYVSNAELLEVECEILVPAATENQITSKNAGRIKCKVLAEGANGPTTANADKILMNNGVFVIPDILANAGGVTVSYFEWVQNRMGYYWRESVVNERLEDIMVASFNDVVRIAESHNVNPRIASYMLAIERVAYDTKMRGIYA